MVTGLVVDFWELFFWRGGRVFLQGVLGKRRVQNVVFLWWIAGESWCVDGHILGDEKFPLFSNLFLGGCR
jgi:hypothetical protein